MLVDECAVGRWLLLIIIQNIIKNIFIYVLNRYLEDEKKKLFNYRNFDKAVVAAAGIGRSIKIPLKLNGKKWTTLPDLKKNVGRNEWKKVIIKNFLSTAWKIGWRDGERDRFMMRN